MAQKALITRRGAPSSAGARLSESTEAEALGLAVEQRLAGGTLVRGDNQQLEALEQQGYRVKLLPDTNILEVGAYRIDVEAGPPDVPARLRVPKSRAKTWPHHLVQLVGPPNEDWVRALEAQGVDVVEPISAYGLFVVGSPAEVARLANLTFVAWVGPFQPAYRIHPNLAGRRGRIEYVNVGVYPESEVDAVKATLERIGATIVRERPPTEGYQGDYAKLIVEVDARHLAMLARLPGVRWLEYASPRPGLDGERETQIVAENLNGAGGGGAAPIVGYQAWLASLPLSGAGVTVAICDSGLDANANNNVSGHVDLLGRQTAFVDYTLGAVASDTDGHGTHVAGIAISNASSGQVEGPAPNNFLWGQGIAPQANYVGQNAIDGAVPFFPPAGDFGTLTRDAVNNGAQVQNNSWFDGGTAGDGYTANARRYDQLARDPNDATPALDHLVIVFSAGNDGGYPTTLTPPHEAKNVIVVGNSLTSRPAAGFPADDIRGLSGTSSRGPAVDGRIMPTVVAPGTNVSSIWAKTGNGGIYGPPIPGTGIADPMNPGSFINQYMFMSGTSMAAPHVTGACALLTEWWRNRTGGKNPSPTMLKALLVNGAEDLVGGANWRCVNRRAADKAAWSLESGSIFRRTLGFVPTTIVSGNSLMTQVASLAAIVASGQWFYDVATDRLFVRMPGNQNPGAGGVPLLSVQDAQAVASVPNGDQGWGRVSLENIILQAPASDRGPKLFTDQRHAFTANGQEHLIRVAPVDPARPLRITLVWTDAPGAANASPALVNDLDLEVAELATGTVYKGNVFANGFSAPGGSFDNLNNVECAYIQNPSGTYEVRVIAAAISANARPPFDNVAWQDFALVIDNADVPAAAPVSVVPVIDRSGSMVAYGYVDLTRTSSKQFVDQLSIDDSLGVASFGTTGDVEYPSGAAPTLQTIVGLATKDAAKAEIDGIVFNGCTFMGEGIIRGRDLLAPAGGSRALVLLSDGYDNKGCDGANPAKPSALDAVATLPAGLPAYTCAMGPASDQALLDQLADASSGRYYYMPTIDDLFEIYNYIRGQVSGDGIIANESALASSSRVGAFVDALATSATFSVAWADDKFRFVAADPKKKNEVNIRLRDPRGHLLHPSCTDVRLTVGRGYVVFKLLEPVPGQWFVEVETAAENHLRYTVGAFVRSPLRQVTSVFPRKVAAGTPLTIAARVFDGQRPIRGFRGQTRVVAPSLSLDGILKKYKDQLKDIKDPQSLGPDQVPPDIAKLPTLQKRVLGADQVDIFATTTSTVTIKEALAGQLVDLGLGHLLPPGIVPVGPGAALPVAAPSGVLTGQFKDTQQQGTYNVVVTTRGTSPVSNTRFVRKELVSVFAT